MTHLLPKFAAVNSLTAGPLQVRRNVAAVERFVRRQKIYSSREISADILRQHLVDLAATGLSPKSLRNHMAAITLFARIALDIDLSGAVRLPKIRRPPPLFLDEDECRLAFAVAESAGSYCEICLAINTGLRRSEMRILLWIDVDLDRRSLLVRRGKGGKSRTVWLNEAAIAALTRQRSAAGESRLVFPGGRATRSGRLGGGSWNRNRPRGMNRWADIIRPLQDTIPKFRMAAKGSTGRGWHLLRHTYASRLAQAGVPITKISQWLGHSNISTTMRYVHLSPDYDPLVERISCGLSGRD